jgi:hypothetical protein
LPSIIICGGWEASASQRKKLPVLSPFQFHDGFLINLHQVIMRELSTTGCVPAMELRPWAMTNELLKLATLFRVTANQLRRLASGTLRSSGGSLTVIEAYVYQETIKTTEAFLPDRCREAANILEEFANTLQALGGKRH